MSTSSSSQKLQLEIRIDNFLSKQGISYQRHLWNCRVTPSSIGWITRWCPKVQRQKTPHFPLGVALFSSKSLGPWLSIETYWNPWWLEDPPTSPCMSSMFRRFFGDWSDWSSKISPCFDGEKKKNDVSTEGHTGFSIGPGGFVGRKPTDSKAEKRVGMVGNIVVLSI